MKTKITTFILNLQFIFRTNYWYLPYKYNKTVDEIINHYVDANEMIIIDRYTAQFGALQMNTHPNITHIEITDFPDLRPSRLTILKVKKIYNSKIKQIKEIKLHTSIYKLEKKYL